MPGSTPHRRSLHPRTPRSWSVALAAALAAGAALAGGAPALAVSADIVIAEVYGGGGNTGAPWRNDFVELYNRGAVAVSVTGWSVQYASSTGSSWAKTDLT